MREGLCRARSFLEIFQSHLGNARERNKLRDVPEGIVGFNRIALGPVAAVVSTASFLEREEEVKKRNEWNGISYNIIRGIFTYNV